MIQYSDTVERKFVGSADASEYEILTDSGWRDCKAVHKTVEYGIYELVARNEFDEHRLSCADTHIVFDEDMRQVFVKDLSAGQSVMTDVGPAKVDSVRALSESDCMYDVELSEDSDHRYYTNGILSHNTTTYTIFCMWLATLFPEKKIMICANKLQTAIEIMDRLRIAYEYLPSFIKPSILVYNKSEITFSNQSTIRAFATSSSASRGFSGNCVTGDTKVTVRLFGFLKLKVPIRWLRHVCRERCGAETQYAEGGDVVLKVED